jgi:hypothetical protein
MRITLSSGVILGVGLVPIAWTATIWLTEILTRGSVWDQNEVWGVMICSVAAPVFLVGLGRLAYDNRPSRKSD